MPDRVGGVVLCGGLSSRMGRPKFSLPFGDEVLLQRVVRVLGEVVCPIVVVAADGQQLPPLPSEVRVVRDRMPELGPLEGIAVGLEAVSQVADAAFVSSCDCPLLSAAFVRHVVGLLGQHELAIPREEKFFHPLAAVYRTSLVDRINELIKQERMRPYFLVESSDARVVAVDELRVTDSNLDSLVNVNTPEDYEAALERVGLQLP